MTHCVDNNLSLSRQQKIHFFLLVLAVVVLGIAIAMGVEFQDVHAPSRDAQGLTNRPEANSGDLVGSFVSRDVLDLDGEALIRRFAHVFSLSDRYKGSVSEDLEQTRPTGHRRARGLVSSRKSGDRVQAWRYAAPESLQEVVECYWAGQWDLRGQEPHRSQLLGDPSVHFVFEDQGPMAGARIVGVWTRRWERVLEDRGRVWGIKLRPGAVRAFLPQSAHRYSNQIVAILKVFPDTDPQQRSRWSDLAHKIEQSKSHRDAFAILSNWLHAQRRSPASATDMQDSILAVQHIYDDHGLLSVEQLSDTTARSRRSLQRLFREHVGATPKWVIRQKRLQEAALRIEASREQTRRSSLVQIAHDLGCSDQAHFSRDFKRAVGRSPKAFWSQD